VRGVCIVATPPATAGRHGSDARTERETPNDARTGGEIRNDAPTGEEARDDAPTGEEARNDARAEGEERNDAPTAEVGAPTLGSAARSGETPGPWPPAGKHAAPEWPGPLSVQVQALRDEIRSLQERLAQAEAQYEAARTEAERTIAAAQAQAAEAEARAAQAEREKEELAVRRAQAQPGRRQSLPLTGAAPQRKTNDNLWKGVL